MKSEQEVDGGVSGVMAGRDVTATTTIKSSGTVVSGNNNNVFIVTSLPEGEKPAVISGAQASELHKLADQIVDAEVKHGRALSKQQCWKKLKEKMGVPMREIPAVRFGLARGYLEGWLRNAIAGERSEPKVRLSDVLVMIRETDSAEIVAKFAKREFGTGLLKSLDPHQLARVASYVQKIKEVGRV